MKDRAPITIHDYDAFMATDEAVKAKLERNQDTGVEAYMAGIVPPFDGFDRDYFNRSFNTSLELDFTSKSAIQERVVDPLSEIAEKNRVKLLVVGGSNEQSHITLQTGRYMGGMDTDQIKDHQAQIRNDWRVRRVESALQGRVIEMDRLVFDGRGNIFLCASGVVPETQKARETIKKLLQRSTQTGNVLYSPRKSINDLDQTELLGLVDFSDITHSGVARIDSNIAPDQLRAFYAETRELRNGIKADPIQVTVAGMYVGTSFDFVNKTAPHMFKSN